MPNFRRNYQPGGTYFFTVVTYNRLPILTNPISRSILRSAWDDVRKRFPFSTLAVCLLPDHLHCIWTLPEDDWNYSMRWKEIKRLFTKAYLPSADTYEVTNASRKKRGEASIWQRRFWEHTIQNDIDLQRHIDYIHFNPVKHSLVENVIDWPWSSYHRYIQRGICDPTWEQRASQAEVNPGE
jgi:putative transposase